MAASSSTCSVTIAILLIICSGASHAQPKRLTCQICTACENGDVGEGVCPVGQMCFTLRRASRGVTERGCGTTCSKEERASQKGDHCHMCDYDRCNAVRRSISVIPREPYVEPEILPLPLDKPDLPGLPPVPVVYDKSRILAMNGTLVDEAATAGSGSRPSDVIGGGAIPEEARKEIEEEERKQAELAAKLKNEEEAARLAKEEEDKRWKEEESKRLMEEERLREEQEEKEEAEKRRKLQEEADEKRRKEEEAEDLDWQRYLDIIEGVFSSDVNNEAKVLENDGPETMLTPPPEGVSDSKSVTPPAINTNAESVPGSKPSFAPTFNFHMFQHILMLISTLFLIV